MIEQMPWFIGVVLGAFFVGILIRWTWQARRKTQYLKSKKSGWPPMPKPLPPPPAAPPPPPTRRELRPITEAEWKSSAWLDVTTHIDAEPIYQKTFRYPVLGPPDDNYHYVLQKNVMNGCYEWVRAMTYTELSEVEK